MIVEASVNVVTSLLSDISIREDDLINPWILWMKQAARASATSVASPPQGSVAWTLSYRAVSETPISNSFAPPLSCNTIRRGKQ